VISRRSLLAGIGALGALGSLATLRLALAAPDAAVAAVIRKRLGYLRIDDATLAAFARDYTASAAIAPAKLRLIAALLPLYRRLPAETASPGSIRYGEERIVTDFLLASDFFRHHGETARPVQYLGLYDPWGSGNCRIELPAGDGGPRAGVGPSSPAASAET